jgi:hypothetical protein
MYPYILYNFAGSLGLLLKATAVLLVTLVEVVILFCEGSDNGTFGEVI